MSAFADESCSYMRDLHTSFLDTQKNTTEGEIIKDFKAKMNRCSDTDEDVCELAPDLSEILEDMKENRNTQNHSIVRDPLFDSVFNTNRETSTCCNMCQGEHMSH